MTVTRAPFLCSRYSSMRGSVESLTAKTSRFRIQGTTDSTLIHCAAQDRKAKGRRVRSRSSLATQGMAMDMQPGQAPFLSQSRYRALVLDPGMQPIDVVNWQRALVLDMLAKVEVLEYYQGVTVNSVSAEFFLPAVLMAKQVGRNASKFSRVPLNRRNIMIRDNLTCQYCGKKPSRVKVTNGLTLDHIVPQSRGGENTWTNLITACSACNTRKADRLLSELRSMKLLSTPKEPSPFDLTMQLAMLGLGNGSLSDIPEEWSNYLFLSGEDSD